MAAEDFSFFLNARPGAFFFVASNPLSAMSGAALPYADYKPPALPLSASSAAAVATVLADLAAADPGSRT